MKEKRGMLLASETLKMVLALISIGFLIFLLAAIYFSSEDTKNLAKAKGSIDKIKTISEGIAANPNYVEIMYGVNPHAWSVFSFTGSALKPNQCSGQNCLCFCDHVREDFLIHQATSRQEKECSNDGACLVIPNLKDFGEIDLGSASALVDLEFSGKANLIEVKKV